MAEKKDDILDKWLAGDISDAEAAKHVSQQELNSYRSILNETDTWQRPEIPSFDPKDIVANYPKHRHQGKQIKMWIPVSIAASVLLATLAVVFWFNDSSSETIYMATDEILEVQLPDGTSTAILSAGSRISWEESDWSDTSRALHAEGLVYLAVKKKGKFQVRTKKGEVRVRGTRFEVGAYDESLMVACYEGSVEAVVSGQNVLLEAGESVFHYNEKWETKKQIDNSQPGWLNSNLSLDDIPLEIVLAILSDTYKLEIEEGSVDLQRRYTGPIPLSDPSKALDLIFTTMNISYTVEGNRIYLVD